MRVFMILIGWMVVSSFGIAARAAETPRAATAQAPASTPSPAQPQLYVVGTSHLDTQWRWTIKNTIDEYIPATMKDNLALIEKYPDYVFSFEGAFRYMLMREYYPEDYARVKQAIADGRWRVAGSWVDAVDTNIPSPESLMRHALYGNGFFRSEFGKTSCDVFLPDCFGFGYALPAIANHCGITGFSTQKLTWGSAVGVPFDIGLWEGVDGSRLVAAINPGEYVARIKTDLSADSAVVATATKQGERSGLYAAFKYFGTGDTGGSPTEESVQWLEKSIAGTGPVKVRSVASDQLARDVMSLPPAGRDRLPVYKGELLMTDHGTGCYTSQAAMKRYNRQNERLADAAERASVLAAWLGGVPYPRQELRDAWIRFLWHQFHDDLTGTSIPEAYVYSWNDEAIAQNQFTSILNGAVGGVARGLDTNVKGVPLVVYNPLGIDREDVVEADVRFDGAIPSVVYVWGPDGKPVPSQARSIERGFHVTFLAKVPAIGFAVFDVRGGDTPMVAATELRASPLSLENARYRVSLNAAGDIASIFDKQAGREILAAPIALQMIADEPTDWAAWEVDYDDIMAKPRSVVGGPPEIRVIENGPALVALEIVRHADGSTFRQVVRLAAGGAGDRIEVVNDVDWWSKGTLLKVAFPFAFSNDKATYDLGLGTIERGVNRKELYEVPAQKWADLTAGDGTYGAAVLNDCKYGWDKPDDHTLRLTLVRTPDVNNRWSWIKDQRSMDLGHHRFTYAVCGHSGDWREARVSHEADRLDGPLVAFQTTSHRGNLLRSFSMIHLSNPAIAVRALKFAEESDEVIVRLQELTGNPQHGVRFDLARPAIVAREVNGAEEAIGPAIIIDGGIQCDFGPYQPRTFAIRIDTPPVALEPPYAKPVDLPFNLEGATVHGATPAISFDGAGNSLPAELLPATVTHGGIAFRMGAAGAPNVLVCRGQKLSLPEGPFDHIYLLGASVGGDRRATFVVDGKPTELRIQDYAEPIGQWDSRLASGKLREERSQILPAYLKTDPIGWLGTHRHLADGKTDSYAFTQFYVYALDVAPWSKTLTLPDDDRIRILAVTVAQDFNAATRPAQPLQDLPRMTGVRLIPESPDFLESTSVTMDTPNAGAEIRFTLDGADPTPSSPRYEVPVRITKTTTVKARAYLTGMDDSFIASLTLNKLVPKPGTSVKEPKPGLACRYFEGEWSKVPDFATLTPVRSEIAETVAIPSYAKPEQIGLQMSGYLKIPQDGLYVLHLFSDDGSVLDLDGARQINNDGLHGRGEETASVGLEAGFHPLSVSFFQGRGDIAFELWIEGPGLKLQQVPPGMLFHAGDAR